MMAQIRYSSLCERWCIWLDKLVGKILSSPRSI